MSASPPKTFEEALAKLPAKRRVFVVEYIDCLNKTEAARRAKFAKPMQEGWRLLRIAEIAEAVRLGLEERAMPREEVLARLAEHASASIEDFISLPAEDDQRADPEQTPGPHVWRLDLVKARTAGKLRLIKKLRWGEFGPELELHDPQAALIALARTHGLFIDRKELTGKDGGPIAVDDIKQRLLDRLAASDAEGEAQEVPGEPEPG